MDPIKRKIIKLSASFPYAFRSVDVDLPGRFMKDDKTEHDCRAYHMSAAEAIIRTEHKPLFEEKVVAYLETIGRIAGKVVEVTEHGFRMTINAPKMQQDRIADKLTWLHNLNRAGIVDDRNFTRHSPVHKSCEISVVTGEKYPASIIDMSQGGMAVNVDVNAPIGSIVKFEDASAIVVRSFEGGLALEFVDKPSRTIVQKYMMTDHL